MEFMLERRRGALGALLTADALVALAIALYLTGSKLAHVPTLCGPLGGCAAVASSSWSEFLGIPVAAFGVLASAATLVGALAWWRRASRNGLGLVWLVSLASLPVLVWLTILELFVIHAFCDWCVAYALTVVAGLVVALAAFRNRPRSDAVPADAGGVFEWD
jgi:uncharacterized membrane protein